MTKTSITFFLSLLINFLINAQTIPYEKLDSISSEISILQLKANDLPYKDAKGNEYEISFSDKNFEILFHNQLAYKSVYKKWDDKEILALTENIDLSKVTAITKHTSFTNVILVKLYFPTGYLKTELFENGILTNTITEEYLEFFTTNLSREKLADSLYDLVVLFKITKGLTTAEKIEEENEYYNSHSEEEFLDKYPLSLKAKQSKLIIKEKEEKSKKGEEYFMKYEYIATFQLGLTIEETIIRYPEFKRHYKYDGNGLFWDYSIASKETKGDIMGLYIKNKKVIGYYGEYRYGDDLNFGKGEKFINDICNENNKKFYFSPEIENYDFSGNKLTVLPENKAGTSTTYSWTKNKKTVSFSHARQPTNTGTGYTTISFSIIDQNLASINADRWGDTQSSTVNLLKSDKTNNAIKTTTSINETSTLDEKTEYEKAKIDYKAGTISKDTYREAIKKYGAYAAFESKRLQKAYQNKEITYSEYNQALKILLRK